jgi:hypothetical protein
VSGSYSGNITPLLVSSSTITIGSERCSGARREYCLSDILLKPVVKIRPLLRKIALVALDPSWHTASYTRDKIKQYLMNSCLLNQMHTHQQGILNYTEFKWMLISGGLWHNNAGQTAILMKPFQVIYYQTDSTRKATTMVYCYHYGINYLDLIQHGARVKAKY